MERSGRSLLGTTPSRTPPTGVTTRSCSATASGSSTAPRVAGRPPRGRWPAGARRGVSRARRWLREHRRVRPPVEGGAGADDLPVPRLVPFRDEDPGRNRGGGLQLEKDRRVVALTDEYLHVEVGRDLEQLPEGREVGVGAGVGLEQAEERHLVGKAGARGSKVAAEDSVVEAAKDGPGVFARSGAGGAHAQVSSGRPVSRNDLRLESTRGQPLLIFSSISEPSSSWTRVSRTMSFTGSTVRVIRVCFRGSAASAG